MSSREDAPNYRSCSELTLKNAWKLSILEDRPILADYWNSSLDGNIILGVKDNGDKLLVKSEDEYTSPVQKIYKIEEEYIVMTENSIYIVSSGISTKRIAS